MSVLRFEETSSRVLAYSRSSDSDEVDDLRRRSILGSQGPEPYLSKLREWGIFQHLRSSDSVIAIDPHPELGIRRGSAIGIRAGAQPLGTVSVQEGAQPLAPLVGQALVGAARVAAAQLVRRRRELAADVRLTQTMLTGLLEGSTCAARPQCWRTRRARPPRARTSNSPGPRCRNVAACATPG
nr:hypothetical protein [Streptomyces sp. TLI_235]